MEYWVIGQMLREGLDVYVPLVDDIGIDAVIRKEDNTFIEAQIKALSNVVKFGDCAFFASIFHPQRRENYFFAFHSVRLGTTWILSSDQLIEASYEIKNGKNKGKRSIRFNGTKIDKTTGERKEFAKPRYDKYLDPNFSQFKKAGALVVKPSPE